MPLDNQPSDYLVNSVSDHPNNAKQALVRFAWSTTSSGWPLAVLAKSLSWRVFWAAVSIVGILICFINLRRLSNDYVSHAVAVNIKVSNLGLDLRMDIGRITSSCSLAAAVFK